MELIKHLARTAKSMMNSGLSLDQCLEFIEEDLRDSVRKELQKENLQP
jgi:hypothetical protein